MSYSVRISVQVAEFSVRLAPEPRRAVKRSLAGLRNEAGDIKALEGDLAGFHRLRVGRLRIIFAYGPGHTIDALFIEERSIVYEIFEAQFVKKLRD